MITADTLWQLIEARAAATPEALLAVDEQDRRMSFGAYRERCERVAAGLFTEGVRPGTPVSWLLPTWNETLVLCGALARIGAVQNPILPIYRHREVGFCTTQTQARLLFVPPTWRNFDYAGMARDLAAERPEMRVRVVERGTADALPEGDPATLPAAGSDAGAVRWVFYTSGTTSDPKGARHTDGTLTAFTQGMVEAFEIVPDDRVALVFPFTHIGGVAWLIASMMSGCSHIVVAQFSPAETIPLLARHGVTLAGAGPAFHLAYLEAQRKRPERPLFPDIRFFPGGGAPKPPGIHADLKRECGGIGVISGYGLTECPIITSNTVHCGDDKLAATEGRVSPPEAEIRAVTLDGRVAKPGEEGELRVRGPQLCKGYVDASLNEAAFDADGFFRTGDLGVIDDEGYVRITGRLKDVIIRNGENISAQEIENLLYEHPKVADAAVIGLPDPRTGERACAVVACRAPADPLGFEEMVEFLKAKQLMMQKIPEQLELVEEVPRNASGKLLKNQLRELYRGQGAG